MWILWVIFHTHQRRWRDQGLIGYIRVLDIPDVRVHAHVQGHLLELQNGVRDGDFVAVVWVPGNGRSCTFDGVGVAGEKTKNGSIKVNISHHSNESFLLLFFV
jgi:hypothetical protein